MPDLTPIGDGLLIRLDPANPIIFAQRHDANPTFDASVQAHFASGATVLVTGEASAKLWQFINGSKPVDDAKPPATGTSYTPVGDGVLIDRPGTARACVVYAENRNTFAVEFTSPLYPVNVFVLGADPRKRWTLVVNGEARSVAPNDVGYSQFWLPASDRYLLTLSAS